MFQRRAQIAAGVLLGLLAAFHAALVFIVNMPTNPIKDAAKPLLLAYDGPHLKQGWEMFAPDPPTENVHVLVRAERADRSTTQWYDATLYLLDRVAANHIAPVREIDQTLWHAALQAEVTPEDEQSKSAVVRAATSVVRLYERSPLLRIQVQLENRAIAPGARSPLIRAVRWQWQTAPAVDALR